MGMLVGMTGHPARPATRRAVVNASAACGRHYRVPTTGRVHCQLSPTARSRVRIVLENPRFTTLAVDRHGIAWGKSTKSRDPSSAYRLYRSKDEGRTWRPVFDFPKGETIYYVSVLSSNTLLVHVSLGTIRLYRSGDGGRRWAEVFQFPPGMTTLTPHSITDDGRFVYVGSYIPVPIPLNKTNFIWRSADDGRTWKLVHRSTGHRHIHFVQADPYTKDVYLGYGDSDSESAIQRSRDRGVSWETVCAGTACTAVDIAFHPSGFAVFGQDHVFEDGFIVRLGLATGALTELAELPGPSYSAFNLGRRRWLVGTTHEPRGTIFAEGDRMVRLFASDDGGKTFTNVFRRPYRSTTGYERLTVQFAYPNGDFPIQISGYGTIVARLSP